MHFPQRRILIASMVAGLCMTAGCGDSTPQAPLLSSTFVGKSPTSATAPSTTAPTPAARVTLAQLPATAPSTQRAAPVRPAGAATLPVMLAPGQYQTIGGVVSEVNGNPIYANRVLRRLRGELSARAIEMDADQFRKFAADEIRKTIVGFEQDELLFAAADRSLKEDDRRLAEFLTMQFRTRKITEAGGSVELAQRKAQIDGDNFEELIYDQYRKYMTDLFHRRNVFPRMQVTADDLRSYYNINVAREFTDLEEITFRLIKVDPRRSGGRDAAEKRARDIARQAATADFAELARTMNHDDRLARAGGEEVPIQRGAYKLEKLEAALWQTPVGSITPVIEDSGAFYIGKVEAHQEGKVQPFEDPKVQALIRRTLERQQFQRMSAEIEATLRKNATVRKDPAMTQAALDLAMQGYAIWTTRGE